MASRYFKSLDGLLAAAEFARLGKHAEAAKFLVAATKLPCYREMAETVTEEQEQNQQEASEQDEQQEQEESAVLTAALARVLEGSSIYPDSDAQEDDLDHQDGFEQAAADDETGDDSVQQDDEQQEQQEEADADGDGDGDFDDLGIDMDEDDDFDSIKAATRIDAALASLRTAAKPAPKTTASLSDRQARLARNKNVRA